jgi:outer membrane lipoprotein-sorting protein
MNLKLCVIVLNVAMLSLLSVPARALTADEIIAKHVAARGSLEKLHALETLRLEGTLRPPGSSLDLHYVEVFKRPEMLRVEVTLQGLTAVQAYDGKTGWQIQPFQGRKDPEQMSADDLRELAEEADFEGPLVDYQAKGHTVDYLGTEDVDGTAAHVLRVGLKNGDQNLLYLDPEAFLVIRVVAKRRLRGAEVETETDLGDYEQVNGVFMPLEIASGPKGSSSKQKITIEHAQANTDVDAKVFALPAAAVAK